MSEYQDEVDLRPYLLALKRRWWQIVLIALLLAGVALAYSLLQPKVYKATAMILLTHSRSRLALAEQFPTENENADAKSRMDALVSITKGDAVAMATLQMIGDRISMDEQDLQQIKNQVEVDAEGDVIKVIVTADSPKPASEIANTWAAQATTAINAAYGGEQPILLIQSGLASAREKYQAAQSAYESFIKGNQITLLETKKAELENILATLAGQQSWQVSFYSRRVQQMDQILADAEALQSRLKGQSDSPAASIGDAIAVLMAHASVFEVNPQVLLESNDPASETSFQNNLLANQVGPVINVQLDGLTELASSPGNYQEDLELLIKQVTLQRDEAKAKLQTLSEEVAQGEGDEMLTEANAQLSQVQERLEIETAHEKELSGERDLARDTYEAMLQKEAELVNASQVINEVTLAGPAVEPQHPADRGTIKNAFFGGIIGMLLAICVIIFLEWWHSTKVSQ
jgi:capsular polysaccharide biosynthesis protein